MSTTELRPEQDRQGNRSRRRRSPAWAAALHASIIVTFLAASSAPTPLYARYQDAWGFAQSGATVAFGVYALALLAALLLFGRISDHVGRRPAVLGAIVLEAAAMAVFLAADGLPALIAARTVQGVATGIVMGSASAGLLDAAPRRGPLVNAVAPMVGMGAGALGSGALVQYAPAPMHLVYAVVLVLFVLQAAALTAVSETTEREPGALASLRPRFSVPPQARRALLVAAPVDIALWALGGFYMSLGPAVTTSVTGSASPVAGGAAVFVLTMAGAVAVLLLRSAPALRVLLIGAPALAAGVAITLAGVHTGLTAVFFAGTAVAGIGFGTGFQGALRTVVPLAAPHERAGLMSAFYILSYMSLCVPAITAGIATDTFGLTAVTDVYGAAVIALAVLAVAGTLAIARSADKN